QLFNITRAEAHSVRELEQRAHRVLTVIIEMGKWTKPAAKVARIGCVEWLVANYCGVCQNSVIDNLIDLAVLALHQAESMALVQAEHGLIYAERNALQRIDPARVLEVAGCECRFNCFLGPRARAANECRADSIVVLCAPSRPIRRRTQ